DDQTVDVHLVHCKYSSKDDSGARLEDLYEVCGQAIRSVKWKSLGMEKIATPLRKRAAQWQQKGFTRFRKGSLSVLRQMEKFARRARISLSIEIVQPGLSRDKASAEMLRLLGSVQEYAHQTARSPLRVVGGT